MNKKKAFALVEALIALLILTIALFSLAAAVLLSHSLALRTLQQEGAYRAGLEALETLEAGGTPVAGVAPFTLSTASADTAEGRRLIVRVTWESPVGSREISLDRVVPRDPDLWVP